MPVARQQRMLIDIGANLTHESFFHDLDEVLVRAARSGSAGMSSRQRTATSAHANACTAT